MYRLKFVSIAFVQLLLLSFCIFNSAYAQTSRIDGLVAQLKKATSDTAQITIFRKLQSAYTSVDPEKKLYYIQAYKKLAEKNKIDSTISDAYQDLGIYHGNKGNVDSALHYFNIGFEKAKHCNYQSGIARSYLNIGYTYHRMLQHNQAIKMYKESLNIFQKLGNQRAINNNNMNIGSVYYDLQEYKLAENYFLEVYNNSFGKVKDERAFAGVLYSLGNTSRELDKPDKALDYYTKSLEIRERIGDISGTALSNWGIGTINHLHKDYAAAIERYKTAITLNESINNPYQIAWVMSDLGKLYLEIGDIENAEKMALKSLAYAKKASAKSIEATALTLLSNIKKADKDSVAAKTLKEKAELITNREQTSQTKFDVIASDLARVKSDKKNLEIENESYTNKLSTFTVAFSVVSLILVISLALSFAYYIRSKERKVMNKALLRQKNELAIVNSELTEKIKLINEQNSELEKLNDVKNKFFSIVSHDLRAPISTLKSLFELYSNNMLTTDELNDLLVKLETTVTNTASFLDNLLEWSKSQLDGATTNPESLSVSNVIDINLRLFESQIRLKNIYTLNNVDTDFFVLTDKNMINVVVRNLLSNAIKFCSNGDSIVFNASRDEKSVTFSITDTGPGISLKDQENLFNIMHSSNMGTAGEKGFHIGLVLCKDMVAQNNGTLRFSTALGKGTTFYITLPIAEKNITATQHTESITFA